MSKGTSLIKLYENERVIFKSYTNEFTSDLYKEFDLKAKNLGLDSKINDLFSGEKVNFTEDSAAWHPKYRNEYNPEKYDTPSNKNQKKEILDLCDMCTSAKNIITLGIGGSFEGSKMILEYMNSEYQEKNFIFITGSDSTEFKIKTKKLEPKETIFLVSSKSFKTVETISTLKDAILWSGDMEKFVAITANKEEIKKYNIKKVIEFDKQIGGRYSIWSEVSVLMYCLNKVGFNEFMAGGMQADIDLNEKSSYIKFVKNLSYSDIWFHNYKNRNSRVVLSYIWSLRSFTDYVQQLEMESLGKHPSKQSEFKKTGQIIFGGYGPTAQHSYFQMLHQGTHDICADIIVSSKDKKSLGYAQAMTQSKLLSEGANEFDGDESINGNTPTNLFSIKDPNLYDLGYMIATWEHRVYITAVMLGINPFDQFGVSAGKIYTKKYLVDID